MAKNNPFTQLLDENNRENVIFYDEKGNPMEFEQVALVPVEDIPYVLLHPLHMGYQEDEVIVYSLLEHGDTYELLEVEDMALLEEIYRNYQSLYKKKNRKNKI